MKKLLDVMLVVAATGFSGMALAADLPVKAPVQRAAPFSWSGCYLGANAGGGWGREDWLFTGNVIPGGAPDPSGWLAGIQGGCDYQTGNWVVGLAGLFDWSKLKGTATDISNPAYNSETDVKSIATTTARLGYAFDRSLLYLDGGAAWSRTRRDFRLISTGVVSPEETHTKSGWTVGAGFEQIFAPNWSWKLEYNYFDFGTATDFVGIAGSTIATPQRIHTVLFGINYRFGDIPPVANR